MPLDSNAAAILLNAADDVAVARRRIAQGDPTGLDDVKAGQAIPRGHKVALRPIAEGAEVHKFGQVIGIATQPIAAGDHVHLHNLASIEQVHAHRFAADTEERGMVPEAERRTFLGDLLPVFWTARSWDFPV